MIKNAPQSGAFYNIQLNQVFYLTLVHALPPQVYPGDRTKNTENEHIPA